MKNKNLIVGVGVAILLYFIFKSKKGKQVTEQVAEKVKETVKPKEKTLLYKGVEMSGTTSNIGKQLIKIDINVMKRLGYNLNSYRTPQDELLFVENSKGERAEVLRINNRGVVIDRTLFDGKRNNPFINRGDTFKLYKEKLS